MGSKRFYIGIAARVIGLALTIAVTFWAIAHTQWQVTVVVLIALALGQVAMLTHYAAVSGREVARFLDALSFDDPSVTFPASRNDGAFRELNLAMTRVLDHLRANRRACEEQAQYLQALIAHVPVPLLTVDADGSVQLLNTAARQLFEGSCGRISQFSRYGEAFATDMEALAPGESLIVRMERNSGVLQLKAAATELAIRATHRRLISLQNIGIELSAQEFAAWQTVIRVMAHEVMNSLTPIASLAGTARGLVSDVLAQLPAADAQRVLLTDAAEALEIISQRTQGLSRFVQNHRRLTRRMVVKVELMPVRRALARLERLIMSELKERNIELILSVSPEPLELSVDPELMDQALLNLARNAMEALRGQDAGRVSICARREPDNRVVIEVADNGPGIPAELRQKVFVPFFTTKRQGSGVGLTLVRQIAVMHGGMVDIRDTPGGGATIRLLFG